MSDEKKAATKEYVVVFDQLDKATGEYRSQGVGMPQVSVVENYFRGDTVSLTDAEAKGHLEVGAVVLKSDKRAKLVEANPVVERGVRRSVDAALPNAVQLEQAEAATAGGSGAKRTPAKLGTKAELEKLGVTELKQLAADHGVTVERGDTKPKLAAKLAKVKVDDAETASGDDTEGTNPGQKHDQSPPPPDQPDETEQSGNE